MRKNRLEKKQTEFSILAVDDDPIMTATIQSYFMAAGYQVDVENDPVIAIERVRNGHYDILITDFLMTPLCGDRLVEKIREFNGDIFIILLTGHKSMAPPIRTIRMLDIQGYFEKSERFDQLELLVESCVKAIRQMKLVRSYQQGLAAMADRMPSIYSAEDPKRMGQQISEGLSSLWDCAGSLLVILPEAEAGTLRFESGDLFAACSGADAETLRQQTAGCAAEGTVLQSEITDSAGRPLGFAAVGLQGKPAAYQEQLFQLFVRQCAASLENSFLTCQLRTNYMEIIQAMRLMVDAKDDYTRGHSDRVSYYSEQLARALGMSEGACERIRIAGQFHDIGKMAIPDQILLSPNRLTDEEFTVIRRHPVFSDTILSAMTTFRDIIPVVRGHHERIDGKGYPDGLAGAEIPFESRIISIADTFDAMTSTRRYRANLSLEEAIRRLKEARGTQLDSRMVDVFLTLVDDHLLEQMREEVTAGLLEKRVQG